MIWGVIQALAAQQHGLVSRAQILAAGATVEWLRWAVEDGRLTRVRQGVYAIAGSASHYQPLMASCLAGGSSVAVSHMAAAALWGAEQVKAGPLEITAFDNRPHQLPGVITHRSRLDATRAITSYLSLPIVVPALTVVQLAGTQHPHLVRSVANDLVKRRWTRFPEILDWIEVMGDGRREALRELCLQAIEVGGHDNSPAARRLAHKLKHAGAPPFELDYPVETPEGFLLIDIAWPKWMVGLEYNGQRDHEGRLAQIDDARRRCRLAAVGWHMLDANRGITDEDVIRWVLAALAKAS